MGSERQTAIGPLPQGWSVCKLKYLATHINSGATPRGGASAYLPTREEYALVRSQNVFDRCFEPDGLAFITQDDAAALRNAELQADDILLNITGDGVTFGRACLMANRQLPACVNQHVVRIRCDKTKCVPAYLLAFLTHPLAKPYIESFNAGGSRRAITKGHIESFEIPLPPPPQQWAIAEVLGSLDDKIELNRRMNRTLESMARALFKSWFIDFDPVHANAAGKQTLPPDLAALFPDAFESSRVGDIPEGWEVRSLDEIADYLNGLALQKYPAEEGAPTLPRLKIAQLRKGDTEGADLSNTNVPDKYVVKDGDVIFSWSGSLLVRIWTGGKAALNQHLFKVTSDKFPRWFYYLWTQHHLDDFQATAAGKATTMGHIQRHHLSDAKVTVPPVSLITLGDGVFSSLIDRIVLNDQEARSLASIRDSLLAPLLSGEIQVNHAERSEP